MKQKDKVFATTFRLETPEVELLQRLKASYGQLAPSDAQVFKMLVISALYTEARQKGWIPPGPTVKL